MQLAGCPHHATPGLWQPSTRPSQAFRRPCYRILAAASQPSRASRTARPSQRPTPSQPADGDRGTAPRKNKLDIWKRVLAKLSGDARAVAAAQLLRIEEEGAFVGLVGGSPVPQGQEQGQQAQQRGQVARASPAEDDEEDMISGRSWREKLSDRDARFVTELVAGVTRWRRRLDFLICHFTRMDDVAALDAPLRQILRMALYELLEQNAPPHVINEHVQLAKRVINAGAGGFANGVLRSVVRAMESHHLPQPPLPPPGASIRAKAESLGIATSHPTWLVERWLLRLGNQQTLALLKWNNARPTHSLRISPALGATPGQLSARLCQSGIAATPSAYLPHEFLRVESGLQALLATGLLSNGMVQVQDEAAGMVVMVLDPQPGESLLDVCAAPGGKTLFAAARMGGTGRILALDVSAPRLQALAAAAQRQGFGSMITTHAADFRQLASGPQKAATTAVGAAVGPLGGTQRMRRLAPTAAAPAQATSLGVSAGRSGGAGQQALLQSQFDRVLLDAPCSGTGVLSKRADLRWRRQPGDLRQLTGLQDELLDSAAAWVKPGGVLVYSTCSIEPEENQVRVARFLSDHPDFSIEPPPPSTSISPDCLTPEGYLQMLPHVHNTDGAFAARLRRRQRPA